jgi:hypothetical protein
MLSTRETASVPSWSTRVVKAKKEQEVFIDTKLFTTKRRRRRRGIAGCPGSGPTQIKQTTEFTSTSKVQQNCRRSRCVYYSDMITIIHG